MDGLRLKSVFECLYQTHGTQDWWPGDTPFEIMVGAILTQNTSWSNVEKAIANLAGHGQLDPVKIASLQPDRLALLLKPSGYFNIKARRLQNFCRWYLEQGSFQALNGRPTAELRSGLLGVNGIGPETADDILLYAFGRPVFVIDAYTRRLFSRLGLIEGDEPYENLRHRLETKLGADVELYNEYHALIVRHAKEVCQVKARCAECVLYRSCPGRQFAV